MIHVKFALLILLSISVACAQQGILRPRQVIAQEPAAPIAEAFRADNSAAAKRAQMGVNATDAGEIQLLSDPAVATGSLRIKGEDLDGPFGQMGILASGSPLRIEGSSTISGIIELNPGAVSGLGRVVVSSGVLDDRGLLVQGITGQTARLFEIENSLGTRLFHIEGEGSSTPGDMISESHFPVSTLTQTLGSTSNAWVSLTSASLIVGLRPSDTGGTGSGTISIANTSNDTYAVLAGTSITGFSDIQFQATPGSLDSFLPAESGIDALGSAALRWDVFADDLNVVTCTGCGAASHPVVDTTIIITDDADVTKQMRFEVGGLTTATTRELTIQDADYILAGTNITNTFSSAQIFNNATAVQWKDSVGTAVNMLDFTVGNAMTIGPTANVADPGDVIFYRDGSAVAKFTSPGSSETFSPDMDNTGDLGDDTLLWSHAHIQRINLGRSLIPRIQGELLLHTGLSLGAATLEALDVNADSLPDLELGTADFVPDVTNIRSIGQSARRWDGFFDTINVNLCEGCGGGLPVVDTTSIVEGSADATKEIRFEVDGLTTATIRVLTPQDADYVLAGTNIAQTFSAIQTYATDIRPDINALRNIGSSSLRFIEGFWIDLDATGVFSGGAQFNQDIRPVGTQDLGASGDEWADVFADRFVTGRNASILGSIDFHHSSTSGTATIRAASVTAGVDLEVTRPFYPSAANSLDNGLATRRWATTFSNGLTLGNNACDFTVVSGAPTGGCTTCDVRLRTDGGASTTLYICEGGSWAAK